MSICNTLKSWFQQPDPPVISREDYAPDLMPANFGPDISGIAPAYGLNAVPPPQHLYDITEYSTDFSAVFNRPRNTLAGT